MKTASAPGETSGGALRWGIVGLGQMAARFGHSLRASESSRLQAVASRSPFRASAFARDHDVVAHPSYQDLFDDPEVDAVYVATTHPTHRELSERASRAGKSVLVEKPMATDTASVRAMIEEARHNKTYLLEGYMYRFHPRTRMILDLLCDGAIGEVIAAEASYGFHAEAASSSRLLDPAAGGGGILDVGGYPVSFVHMVAAAVAGAEPGEIARISGAGTIGSTGVDVWACASLRFNSGFTGLISCGVQAPAHNDVRIIGSGGRLEIADPWVPTAGDKASFYLTRVGHEPLLLWTPSVDQYAAEADAVARDRGLLESAEMTWADSIDNASYLESWRCGVNEHAKRGDRDHPLRDQADP